MIDAQFSTLDWLNKPGEMEKVKIIYLINWLKLTDSYLYFSKVLTYFNDSQSKWSNSNMEKCRYPQFIWVYYDQNQSCLQVKKIRHDFGTSKKRKMDNKNEIEIRMIAIRVDFGLELVIYNFERDRIISNQNFKSSIFWWFRIYPD